MRAATQALLILVVLVTRTAGVRFRQNYPGGYNGRVPFGFAAANAFGPGLPPFGPEILPFVTEDADNEPEKPWRQGWLGQNGLDQSWTYQEQYGSQWGEPGNTPVYVDYTPPTETGTSTGNEVNSTAANNTINSTDTLNTAGPPRAPTAAVSNSTVRNANGSDGMTTGPIKDNHEATNNTATENVSGHDAVTTDATPGNSRDFRAPSGQAVANGSDGMTTSPIKDNQEATNNTATDNVNDHDAVTTDATPGNSRDFRAPSGQAVATSS